MYMPTYTNKSYSSPFHTCKLQCFSTSLVSLHDYQTYDYYCISIYSCFRCLSLAISFASQSAWSLIRGSIAFRFGRLVVPAITGAFVSKPVTLPRIPRVPQERPQEPRIPRARPRVPVTSSGVSVTTSILVTTSRDPRARPRVLRARPRVPRIPRARPRVSVCVP